MTFKPEHLEREAASIELLAKMDLKAEIETSRLPDVANVFKIAAAGMRLRELERRYPSRWACFYIGFFAALLLVHIIGG